MSIGNMYQYAIDYFHEYVIFDDFGSCRLPFAVTVAGRNLFPVANVAPLTLVVHLTLHFSVSGFDQSIIEQILI